MSATIKIACRSSEGSEPYQREVEGEIIGSWAAHVDISGTSFKVTFIPFGLAAPFTFKTMKDARATAEAVNALRSDWSDVTHAAIRSMSKDLIAICEINGGERLGTAVFKGEPAPVDSLPTDQNSTQRATTW